MTVEIEGFTHSQSDTLGFVEIVITEGQDTLQTLKSDVHGYYNWKTEAEPDSELTFSANTPHYMDHTVDLIVQSYPMEMKIDFDFIEIVIDATNYPRYEANITDTFTGFDLELFKRQFRKIDTFCVVFSHVTYMNESDEIAQKRIANFKQFLIDGGIDLSNFRFETKQRILDCEYQDCRAAIHGEMISLEESCQ